MRKYRFLGQFQNGDRMFASHRWKILQELIERVAFFEVVKQGLHRHAGPGENHNTAHDLI